MSKEIKIILSDNADGHLSNVIQTIELETASESDLINYCLTELLIFEIIHGESLTSWMLKNMPNDYREAQNTLGILPTQ